MKVQIIDVHATNFVTCFAIKMFSLKILEWKSSCCEGASNPFFLPHLFVWLRKEACLSLLQPSDALSYLNVPVVVAAPCTAFLLASIKTIFTSSRALHLKESSESLKHRPYASKKGPFPTQGVGVETHTFLAASHTVQRNRCEFTCSLSESRVKRQVFTLVNQNL